MRSILLALALVLGSPSVAAADQYSKHFLKELADALAPYLPVGGGGGPHAASHGDGGSDEISIAGLSGVAADPQPPAAHLHALADLPGELITASELATELLLYQLVSGKNAANGYAGLDAGTKLLLAQLPTHSHVLAELPAALITDTELAAELALYSTLNHDILAGHAGFPGGTTNFLRADGTFAQPAGGSGGPTKLTGSSGAFAADTTWLTLDANSADITSLTQTAVMTLTGVPAGTYRIKALLVFQTAATTTGIGITLNHAGTVSRFVYNWMHVTTGGAAATGVSDQAAATAAGQLMEGKAERVKDTRSSFTVGVDTANADELAVLDAAVIVTASGDLEIKIATEISGSAVRLMAGSTLEVHKVA